MESLIGKKFKRNKYSLSDWTHDITDSMVLRSYSHDFMWHPRIKIKGNNKWYDIDEIVIVD